MTDPVTTTSPASQPSGTAARPKSDAGAASVLSSDFETFLKMLTAQARYQDPLEPIDSSEYAAQLAQFSMVEQQVMSNDLLAALSAQLGAGNMAQMSGWIGMEARTSAAVPFDGRPITINPDPADLADEAVLVVYDAADNEVQRAAIPVSSEPLQWAGAAQNGTPFPSGLYRFEVESRANGKVIRADPAETYTRITEARIEGSETILILEGGASIPSASVTGLRGPQGD